jgi:DNA-binding transcriptional ArsR family regulator
MVAGRVRAARPDWTLLSNHGHVLVCIARAHAAGSEVRLRSIAQQVGITERSVYGILADLEAAGILTRHREGRTSRYEIHRDVPLRHALESHVTLGDLLALVATQSAGQAPGQAPASGPMAETAMPTDTGDTHGSGGVFTTCYEPDVPTVR